MNLDDTTRGKIDSMSEDELLHEINLGAKSRFQGSKFAYVKTRLGHLKNKQEQDARDAQQEAVREANFIAKRGWWVQAGIALLGAIAAGVATWFLNHLADEQRDRERFIDRRETLLQRIVADDNQMKLLQFQGTWLLREMRDAEQENLLWGDEKVESAKMMLGLHTFIEQTLPQLVVRPYPAGEIGNWTLSPENERKLQEASRFESRYAGMAEFRGFEITLKTGDQLSAVIDKRRQARFRHRPASPPMPASAPS